MSTIYCIRPKGFNVGNDVIYVAMRHFLYEAFGRVVNIINLPATSRYESHAIAGLAPRTIYEINQYGHGVIIGGGNLYENGELEISRDALKALEVPLMLFSLSKGRIYNQRGELVPRSDAMPDESIKNLNNAAFLSLARDASTHKHLQDLGLSRVRLGGCPSLFLGEISSRLPEIHKPDKGVILISVRTPDLMSIPLDKKILLREQILEIANFLRASGSAEVKLLCHDHRDIPFAATFPDLEYVYTGDVYAFLALLKNCSLCVSFRLHATLPCLAFDTPVINISYDERAASMMETLGLSSWDVQLCSNNPLVESVTKRVSQLDSLEKLKTERMPEWNTLRSTMYDSLVEFAREVERRRNDH